MLVLSTVTNLIIPEDGKSCRDTDVKNRHENAPKTRKREFPPINAIILTPIAPISVVHGH